MLDGVLTCAIPGPATPVEEGVLRGRGRYGLVLTPKGKIVTDLRIFPLGGGPDPGFLLDVSAAGRDALDAHFGKFLPPRLAKAEDVSGVTGMLTFLGPGAPELLTRDALGLRVDPDALAALDEGELRLVGQRLDRDVAVVGTRDVAAPAFDLLAHRDTVESLRDRLREAGVAELSPEAWEALRIEAGRPAFGVDMNADTIPVEAGVHQRAIDYQKGCYTGQEVIVRIRDRGRVNRHLRGVLLGDEPPPPAETELFSPEEEKAVGRITSAAFSPRLGQTAGLGYVRREVEPPAVVRLASVEGAEAEVRALDGSWGPEG
jgi:folate-binding protein YgfZ